MARVEITQSDIDTCGNGAFDCAFANAVNRILRPELECGTSYADAEIYNRNNKTMKECFVNLPSYVGEWISQFDRDRAKVQPVIFDVPIPEKYLR